MTRLPGMFAFGIWDNRNQTLFAARDRFGEKPFFYAFENNIFVFASEIKAILSSGLIKPEINELALKDFFTLGYIDPERTIFKNIKVLAPANYLIYHQGKIKIERYWKIPEEKLAISYNDAIEQFKYLLQKSVKKQLVADVQVGSFLSGGLDSSSIVSVAVMNNKINTYSFGFENENNELPYAKEVADKFNVNHYELYCRNVDLTDTLEKLSTVFDEPFSSASNIPMYHICKQASQHQKVILTGDGGDELLGGYTWWYNKLKLIQKIQNKSLKEKQTIRFLSYFESLLRKFSLVRTRHYRDLQLAINSYKRYGSILNTHISNINAYESDLIYIGLNHQESDNYNIPWEERNSIEDAMLYDLNKFMVGEVLVKTDRCSMAHSIELRAPFLDMELVEFCLKLPLEYKISFESDKKILRDSMKNILPDSIITRSKQGFGTPQSYFNNKQDEMTIMSEIINHNNPIFDYIDFKGIKKLIDVKPVRAYDLLVLCFWANNYLKSQSYA